MKQRVISGVVIGIITIVACLIGNYFLDLVCIFIDLYASKEVIDLRKNKSFSYSLYIIMAISTLLITFGSYYISQDVQAIVLFIEPIVLSIFAIFNKDISFGDITTVFFLSIFIGYSTCYFIYFDGFSKFLFGYIIIIAYLTDVFAYLVGLKFGKHKLNERISPKKTIEGFIGGWFFGAAISFVFAWIFKFFYTNPIIFVVSSLTLPLISQLGDLLFSMIKRYYDVKDFSNLIPGHGGLLDRLDSLLTITLFLGAIWIILA